MSEYVEEEDYFEADRRARRDGFQCVIVDKKWSGGSSPVRLIKYKVMRIVQEQSQQEQSQSDH